MGAIFTDPTTARHREYVDTIIIPEGEEAEVGTSREDGQKKKRKRDAKFEDKHPTD